MKSFLQSNFPHDPNSLGNLVMKTALAEAQKKTNSMRCPQHGQPPAIRINNLGELAIGGCCATFQNRVNQALHR